MQPKGGGRVFVWAYMLDNRYIDERLYVVLVLLVNAPFASALPQLQCSAPCSIRAEFNRPPFFCRAFFWALLGLIPASGSFAGFCFPGSALTPLGSLPESSRSLWKEKPLAFGYPRKWGRKRRHFHVLLNSVTIVGFVGDDSEQR